VGPGLGLSNILLYWGTGEGSTIVALLLVTLAAGSAALTAWGLRPLGWAGFAAAVLVGLWFLPSASPHPVAVPLALIVLGVIPSPWKGEGQR